MYEMITTRGTFLIDNLVKMHLKTSIKGYNSIFQTLPFKKFFSTSVKWVKPTGHSTGIEVYNSATKCKVPFILRNKNYASWYMCGPTVYDSAHIGHACCYVKFDIIRRILQNFFDINVVLVMGITDIDDKIINRAHLLKEDFKILSSRYETEFFKDLNDLNVIPPTVAVRVTAVIPDIIIFIQNILDHGMAYTTDDGSVYFDTSVYEHYGKFSSISQESGFISKSKKAPNDFALWKAAKPDEPFWNSPWGKGRPGWHIECSTIASKIFGSTVDIHSGGIDLVFPHHENEEAQSCAYHCVNQWVNYWLHTGHLHLKGDEKMSKSLKNSVSIQEFLSLNSADHFRMYCLLSRYRNDMEFTEEAFAHAKSIYKKIQYFLSDCDAYVKGIRYYNQNQESVLLNQLAVTQQNFLSALIDDFDTARAMRILSEFISESNGMLHTKSEDSVSGCGNPGVVAAVAMFVSDVTRKLGLRLLNHESLLYLEGHTSRIMDTVIDFRSEVRKVALSNLKAKTVPCKESDLKLIKECDRLRDNLNLIGVEIKDHGEQSTWNLKERT